MRICSLHQTHDLTVRPAVMKNRDVATVRAVPTGQLRHREPGRHQAVLHGCDGLDRGDSERAADPALTRAFGGQVTIIARWPCILPIKEPAEIFSLGSWLVSLVAARLTARNHRSRIVMSPPSGAVSMVISLLWPGMSYADPMVATRVTLDSQRPCLECGAPWRVVARAPISGKAAGVPVKWEDDDGSCSARCWESDPKAYENGRRARPARGWNRQPPSAR